MKHSMISMRILLWFQWAFIMISMSIHLLWTFYYMSFASIMNILLYEFRIYYEHFIMSYFACITNILLYQFYFYYEVFILCIIYIIIFAFSKRKISKVKEKYIFQDFMVFQNLVFQLQINYLNLKILILIFHIILKINKFR